MKKILNKGLLVCGGLIAVLGALAYMEKKDGDPLAVSSIHENLTRTYTHRIKVRNGSPVRVQFKSSTESGSLELTITDSIGTVLYSGRESSLSEGEQVLTVADTYTVTIKAENHSGSFALSWAENA